MYVIFKRQEKTNIQLKSNSVSISLWKWFLFHQCKGFKILLLILSDILVERSPFPYLC